MIDRNLTGGCGFSPKLITIDQGNGDIGPALRPTLAGGECPHLGTMIGGIVPYFQNAITPIGRTLPFQEQINLGGGGVNVIQRDKNFLIYPKRSSRPVNITATTHVQSVAGNGVAIGCAVPVTAQNAIGPVEIIKDAGRGEATGVRGVGRPRYGGVVGGVRGRR